MRIQPWLQRCVAVLVLIGTVAVIAACGGGAADPGDTIDPQALMEERCSECHGLAQVTEARKTEAEWEATVTNMVSRGARLDAEEQEALVAYLAETYAP